MQHVKNKRILCLLSSEENEDIFNLPLLGKEGAGHSKRADRGSGMVAALFSSQAAKGE